MHESPEEPELAIRGNHDNPEEAGRRIVELLVSKAFLKAGQRLYVVSKITFCEIIARHLIAAAQSILMKFGFMTKSFLLSRLQLQTSV